MATNDDGDKPASQSYDAELLQRVMRLGPWPGIFILVGVTLVTGILLTALTGDGAPKDIGGSLVAGSVVGLVFAWGQYLVDAHAKVREVLRQNAAQQLEQQQQRAAVEQQESIAWRLHILQRDDLNGIRLPRRNLAGWWFRGKALKDANFEAADLADADLSHCDLSGAFLRFARLARADLRYSKLIGADLVGADLRRAKLEGADLTDARLVGTKLVYLDPKTGEQQAPPDADLTNAYAPHGTTTWPKNFDYEARGVYTYTMELLRDPDRPFE